MTEKKNIISSLASRFALRGVGGLVILAVISLIAFSIGAIFSGGDQPVPEAGAGHDHAAEATQAPTEWTCSMHPQIKLPKAGKCPICFMDLIPLDVSSDGDAGPRQLRMSETAKELARIETVPVRRAFAESEIRLVGKIDYDETKVSHITAWVGGRLDRLYADFTGITVKQGDHLASIYSPELIATQEELLQALSASVALDQTTSSVLASTAAATVDASREKLRLYGLSEKQIAKIEADGEASDHLTINAPIGGVVVDKNAQEGMYVKTGSRIYTIADLNSLWVLVEAYESDLPWIRYGQQLTFTSPSFPGETFEATISFIDPVVDPKTRTVQVRAIVANPGLRLKPNMFVRGLVRSKVNAAGDVVDEYLAGKWISPMHPEIVKDGPGRCDKCGMPLVTAESLGYAGKAADLTDAPLLIPATAPLLTGKRAVVYVEIPNDDAPLFEGRDVELGPRAGDFYVVKSGLMEGELVVTNGAFKIDSELQIQAKPSMMSPDGGASGAGHQHGQSMPAMAPVANAKNKPNTESSNARKALRPVYTAYFEVQMALADDDLETAKSAAGRLGDQTTQVDMSLFSRSGHGRWMELSQQVSNSATVVAAATDIDAARTGFLSLAQAVVDLQETFGHDGDGDYYLTYCPMANGNQGAYWLQTVDTVYNSFYGAMMLRCGEIKKPLSPIATGLK